MGPGVSCDKICESSAALGGNTTAGLISPGGVDVEKNPRMTQAPDIVMAQRTTIPIAYLAIGRFGLPFPPAFGAWAPLIVPPTCR